MSASPPPAGSPPPRSNVELKARLPEPERARAVCRELEAVDHGVEEQEDTYFALAPRRVKLRVSSWGRHWLIHYARPDASTARRSDFTLDPVDDPERVRSELTARHGVVVVVRKRRNLWIWRERVRIHLDEVEELGGYLEFEAMLDTSPNYAEADGHADVAHLREAFGIDDADLVSTSYSALVLDRLGDA